MEVARCAWEGLREWFDGVDGKAGAGSCSRGEGVDGLLRGIEVAVGFSYHDLMDLSHERCVRTSGASKSNLFHLPIFNL